MKKRISLLLACVLLFAALSPMALADGPELSAPADDPLEPEPFLHIDSIARRLEISNYIADCYCSVYIADTNYTCELTMDLQRRASDNEPFEDFYTWSTTSTGTTTYLDKSKAVYADYTYRVAATVDVFNSAGQLAESVTRYSSYVTY